MQQEKLPEFIQALLNPRLYNHPVEKIELVQTHISYILLAGDYVYKFKKPVNFNFLDFSTLKKRKFYCEQECLLNQRLCPTIYLETIRIGQTALGWALGGEEPIVDYGVKMRRMPEERMMGHLLRNHQLTPAHLDGIIKVLVPFYQQAAHNPEIDAYGFADKIAINTRENFQQTAAFVDSPALSKIQHDALQAKVEEQLAQTEKFAARVKEGYICDGHGDLHSGNICLLPRVQVFDCIEFNQRFRFADVAADIAFLAMDLDFHGQEAAADYFVTRFSQASNDPGLLAMLNFYKCYRAYVRGKVGLLTAADPTLSSEAQAVQTEIAAAYFQLACRYIND